MISAALVKELRDKTGAGMMDCKSALTQANGDFEKAIEILRKKGASVAAKRAERTASEGIVLTKVIDDGKKGYIVEVNCETDFVAKSDDFLNFANVVMDVVLEKEPADVEALLNLNRDGKTLKDELNETIGKIGEKIEVSRIAAVHGEDSVFADYIHHGSKLGVLVKADGIGNNYNSELENILKDIAMQVAAMKPSFVNRDAVPKDVIEKEIDIYKEIARKEGKPEQILQKIAEGRLNKFYQENCLIEQAYIKDNAKSINDLIGEFNKKYSANVKVDAFYRFHVSDENK
ncbi:MAG: translation elongation factor Ts [Ignavibacteriales bacterium]|nr:translation elongation factor Ts [Ignavibacteriales bacterium]MCF8305361.1 translation elongation factor Ts [Ignavibacteriales bacterium]MCF8436546.1 translation elongation factor Ts [Ignavibacteriales bacterium]